MGSESTVAVPQVMQNTPEKTVQSLLQAFIEGAVEAVEELIEPSPMNGLVICKKGDYWYFSGVGEFPPPGWVKE